MNKVLDDDGERMMNPDDSDKENMSLKKSEAQGSCLSVGDLVGKDEDLSSRKYKEENKVNQLCPKRELPPPPRMEVPLIIKELFDNIVIDFDDLLDDLDDSQMIDPDPVAPIMDIPEGTEELREGILNFKL